MEYFKPPSFKNDQYFILNKKYYKDSLRQIERIIKEDDGKNEPFEKVWIPEKQIRGSINKIDCFTFEKVNEFYSSSLKNIIEKETGIQDLELVAVRRNILNADDSVAMHEDADGYVVIIDIPQPEEEDKDKNKQKTNIRNKKFEGGNILFKKDNGEVVEIELGAEEMLVAKCTNEHGVNKILSGTRESIALFSRPK